MSTQADPRQLCVIGAAQHSVRDGQAPEPLVSWAARAREAAADAGVPDALRQLDSLQVVYCQTWPYDDPVGRLADALGTSPRHRVYSGIGGTTPQDLLGQTAEAMQRGELSLALLCSAEALATTRAAKRSGERLPWSHRSSTRTPWELPHPSEVAHEVYQAWETFPLFDTARRARRRASLAEDAAEAARVMAAMSHVAAHNPHAWRPRALDAATIGTASATNRYVGWPYTKLEVAVMDVDMSAALLVATKQTADAMGVNDAHRLYLSSWARAEDPAGVAERIDMSRSRAMEVVGARALADAGVALEQIDLLDLYSCFPSSVRFACDALGLDVDEPRGLTVTGGLPYAGGPASAYMMHAVASAFEATRGYGGNALLTGVGMHMNKHVAAVWSTTPGTTRLAADQTISPARHPVLTAWSGHATVAAYTVAHGRDGAAEQGLLVLDAPEGRVLARVTDESLLADAESRELVGQSVVVTTDGKRNLARW